jgi:hypothetical protein
LGDGGRCCRGGICFALRPDDVRAEKLACLGADNVAVVGAAPEGRVIPRDQVWSIVLEPEFAGTLAEGGEVGFREHYSKFGTTAAKIQPSKADIRVERYLLSFNLHQGMVHRLERTRGPQLS